MGTDPHGEIQRILNEYESRESGDLPFPKDAYIGTIWFEPNSGQTYVCHGCINGELKWSEVNSTM